MEMEMESETEVLVTEMNCLVAFWDVEESLRGAARVLNCMNVGKMDFLMLFYGREGLLDQIRWI